MNRTHYFNYIEKKLNVLATRINSRGKLNLLDMHSQSEYFYMHFFNVLFNWELKNLNEVFHNVEAIDLIDNSNKYFIQVSATNTKKKVESALNKNTMKNYPGYHFKFISISKDASNLKKMTFINPYSVTFNPLTDIYDKDSILKHILSLKVEDQKIIYRFIKNELGAEVDDVKWESNLAIVINILSKEDRDKQDQPIVINSFEIERKLTYNNLNDAKYVIDDYKIHHNRVDKIYAEFDTSGVNKSSTVLATIRQEYIKAKTTGTDDELFFQVIEKIQEKILNSANYVQIPIEELEECVNILVVDAFIRCKIFKNPKDYNYAST
ncbi:SMEK domain-containing protein [bacterium]|nr:SMEK domain-containing protein [bacterium]MBU1634705.1 SMEK domain-containing protein [bacterium]MBU1874788.1 SMEK domain-containing protein [bacterium]